MPKQIATIEIGSWMWASWENPPFSMGDTTAAANGISVETIEHIHADLPTLTISYGGNDYEVTGELGSWGSYYGDKTFVEYPFYIAVDPVPSDPNYSAGIHVRIPVENPGTVTFTLYEEGGDPLACNWKENIILTPPEEEECIPCEEIADLDERATALDERVTALEESGSDYTTAQIYIGPEDWSNNTATKAVTGVTTTNTVIVSPAPNSAEAYATAGVLCTAQGDGTLTFTCDTVSNVDLYVNIVIM